MQPMPKFPHKFISQLRNACKNYDNPSKIGRTPLASVALQAALLKSPTHPTGESGRGEALKLLIGQSLGQLESPTPYSREGEVYLCLYSYIRQQDPFTGSPIGELLLYLKNKYGITKGTYHNRQKEGLQQLAYAISTALAQQITWSEAVPEGRGFVGRQEALAFYEQQLKTEQLAVIEGVGGIGKTALAAQLLKRIERPICWCTIRPGLNDSPRGLLYAWAAFLAQHDYPHLWAFMRATADQKRRLNEFFPPLREGLAKVQALLCVDNLEALPNQQKGVWSLLQMVQQEAHTSLLLISQQRPPLPRLADYPLLSGLSAAEVQLFMAQHQIELTLPDAKTLTSHTLGNASLLELWAVHLRLLKFDFPNSLAELQASQAVKHLLTNKVVGALTESQLRAAHLLLLSRRSLDSTLLLNPTHELPLTELVITPDDFIALHKLDLLRQTRGDQWTLPPLLRNYLEADLAKSLTTKDRSVYHQWLARLSILQSNTLEAAYHAIEGEQREEAILWLYEQRHLLIEQGQASAMSALLVKIEADKLSLPVRQLLRDIRLELLQLLGEYKAAEEEARLAAHEATSVIEQAQTKRVQGELAKQAGQTKIATSHYQHALRLLATKQASVEAWLHRDLAWSLMRDNELYEAWNEAQRAQIALQNTFGSIAWRRGEFEIALHHFEQGEAMAKEYDEPHLLAQVLNNLALLYVDQEKFKEAMAIFKENLHLSEEIGAPHYKAIALFQLGFLYTKLDSDKIEMAISHLTEALPLFTSLGDSYGQTLAQLNLAKQHLRLKQLELARQHSEAALALNQALGSNRAHAKALHTHAQLLLAENNASAAQTTAHQALDELRIPAAPETFSDVKEAISIHETLAHIYKRLGQRANAKKYQSQAEQLGQTLR